MSDKIVNVYVGECFQEGRQAGGGGELSNAVIDKVSAFIDGIFDIKLNPDEVYYGGQNKTYPLIVTGNGDNVPLMLNFYGDVAGDADSLVLEGFFTTKSSPISNYSLYHLFDPSTHEFFYKGEKLEFDNGGNIDVTSIPKGLPFVQLEARRQG